MAKLLRLACRFVTISALGLWLGGFTVYTGIVIPIGHRQLGSGRFGFVTGQVTNLLSVLAAAALLVLLVNLLTEWGAMGGRVRWVLVGTWVLILASLVVLLFLHSRLDELLDYKSREISNQDRFQSLHERYELVATLQWASGIVYLWCLLAAWRRADQSRPSGV
jgi:hypothetical protein